MTKFLISIRNPREARLLARYPVGVVDLKDPGKGGLGRLEAHEIEPIISQLDDSVPKSIAFGELLEVKSSFHPEYFNTWSHRRDFSFVKFGLAGMANTSANTADDWQSVWLKYHQVIANFSSLVAVFYSDWKSCAAPGADEILEFLSSLVTRDDGATRTSSQHLLIDTFDKTKGTSVEWLGWSRIESLIHRCNEKGIKTVLAGSIELKDLDQLISLQPDYIGLRGAVCRGGREELDESKLEALFSRTD